MLLNKFKAWDEELNKVYSGEDIEEQPNLDSLLSYGELAIFRIDDEGNYKELEPLQYIGMRDKNHIEIYEGHIVSTGSSELMVIVYDEKQCTFKACPISAYVINAGNGGYTGYRVPSYSEVVGNIYENPEYLKV